ncbi:MAG: flippase-like domain-containing protein [Chloroflexi bacterium]|nr:flippase-like domain-containing protein [Chloroflexota bacterium]
MLKKRRFWIGAAGSILFLGLFFWRTDLREMGRAFKDADYIYLLPAIALYFLSVWFRAIRWYYLLAPIRVVAYRRLYSVVFIGLMANNLLPLRLGELVRAYILGEKERTSKAAILGTIAAERGFDGITLVLFLAAVMLLPFVPLEPWLRSVAIVGAAGFLALLIVFGLLVYNRERGAAIVGKLLAKAPARWAQPGQRLFESFVYGLEALRQPGKVAAILIASFLIWLVEATMYYIVSFSFHLDLPYYTFIMVAAAANLAIALPSTQGGIGPFELLAAKTLTLGIFGIAQGVANAYAIVLHATLLLPVVLVGLGFLWLENMSLGQAIREEARAGLVGDAEVQA